MKMTKDSYIVVVTGIAVVGALILLQTRVSELTKIVRQQAASSPAVKAQVTSTATGTFFDQDDEPPLQFHKAAEIEMNSAPSLKAKDVKAFAQALAEADEWLFDPAEQQQASSTIKAQIQTLRVWLKTEIDSSLSLALNAEKGGKAATFLQRVNTLLGLYPHPADEAQQAELETITISISNTSRRVDELRRLRYNQWAILRIEEGVRQFHDNKNVGPDAIVAACVNALAYIDPTHIEPCVMDLYQYLVQITKEKVGDPYYSRIAKGITNPAVARLTPYNFDE